jgi:purine-binding chemotaxis protein CheW
MATPTTIASAPSAQTAADQPQQLVVFSMHGEHYALPIVAIREIIRHQRPRAIGSISSLMQGVINLRGRVLPVCDLSSELGAMLEISEDTRILVVDTDGSVVGLIVDSVDEVLDVTPGQIEDLPVSDTGLGSQIVKIDDRLIILIDTERTFAGVLNTHTIDDPEPYDEAPAAA